MATVLLNKLQPGKTYTVAVRAIDSDGNVSPNSITYTFTTPTANLDGTPLVGYNNAVTVSVGASGAMTAGTLDYNGLQTAGTLNLYDVWVKTVDTGSGYKNLTGASGGAIIINQNGILGYAITSSATSGSSQGTAKFLLDNKSGDAYFNGTIWTTSKVGSLPIADWTASQINNSPLVGSAYNVAASALLKADSASTNTLNYLGVKNTSISGSALISSANTITNASNQLTTISSNGITITTASGASAASASGARIVLNSVGFASYNTSGSPTVTITAADGTARFTGSVFATAGLIGGFNLTASNQNGDAQMYIGTASQQNWTGMIPGTQWSFFSGALDNTGSAALFRVSNAGLLYAQNAVITGSITAQYGVIGNWIIGTDRLYASGNAANFAGMVPGTTNVFFGGATSASGDNATFRVTNTGSVFSTAGYLGGWQIGQTSLSISNVNLNLLTQYNPSFYTSDVYWTGSGYNTNYSVSTNTDGESGYLQWSQSVSGPATASFFEAIFSISTNNLSRPTNTILGMSSGSSYNFSAYVKGGTATSVKPLIRYYTASSAGTLIATTSGATYSIGTSSFTRVDISFTASSNGTYYEFVLQDPSTSSWSGPPGATKINFYFDNVMLNTGTTPYTYLEDQSITFNNASATDPITITNGATTAFSINKYNLTTINSGSFGYLYTGGRSTSTTNLTPRTVLSADNLVVISRSGGAPLVLQRPESPTGTSNLQSFIWGSTNVGNISYSTSTGNLTYGGTSDYRLKKDIEPLSNSIERLIKLNPVSFNWIKNTSPIKTDGFIAHELQEVVPSAVTGFKDEVDENNDPIYQNIDGSKVIPLLVSALQETLIKIEELEQRLALLENK